MPPSSPPLTDSHVHCPACDYNLTGASSARCPWCGWELDETALVAAVGGWTNVHRASAAVASAACGVGSLFGLAVLAGGKRELSLWDGFAMVGVSVAALGHLALAGLLIAGGARRPSRYCEIGHILRFVGWFGIALGAIAAMAMLRSREVHGVPTAAALEFLLAASLFTMPGWMLLLMHLVTMRDADLTLSSRSLLGGSVSGAAVALPFEIKVLGAYRAEDVVTAWDEQARPRSPEIEAGIARVWEAETALAQARGRLLYNADLVRLVRIEGTSPLRLALGPTSYRDFLGTNLRMPADPLAVGREQLSNALGVSVIIATADGFLAFGRRGDRVASHAGFLHCIGGMVEFSDRRADGTVDLFGAITREIEEELGVDVRRVGELVLIGMVRDRAIDQPEAVFEATVDLSHRELEALFDPRRSEGEHVGVEFVPQEPEAVLPFLAVSAPVTAVAEAALLLQGRRQWGRDWYEQACFLRYGELPVNQLRA